MLFFKFVYCFIFLSLWQIKLNSTIGFFISLSVIGAGALEGIEIAADKIQVRI